MTTWKSLFAGTLSEINSDLTGFTQSWYNEVVDTEWGDDGALVSKTYADPRNECQSWDAGKDNCMIGHYTQVVWAKSTKVGCGYVARPFVAEELWHIPLHTFTFYRACQGSAAWPELALGEVRGEC
jgi:hypothetical protein